MDMSEQERFFRILVETYVEMLNKRVEIVVASGKRPVYKNFGFTIGPKYARIFHTSGTSRSVTAFIGRDHKVRRADSWRKVGRVLGDVSSDALQEGLAGVHFATSGK